MSKLTQEDRDCLMEQIRVILANLDQTPDGACEALKLELRHATRLLSLDGQRLAVLGCESRRPFYPTRDGPEFDRPNADDFPVIASYQGTHILTIVGSPKVWTKAASESTMHSVSLTVEDSEVAILTISSIPLFDPKDFSGPPEFFELAKMIAEQIRKGHSSGQSGRFSWRCAD